MITIAVDEDSVINLDGEAMMTNRVVMRVEPGAVNLIVPRGMRFFD